MQNRTRFILAAAAAVPFVAGHAQAQQTVRLFWFAGQSNMVGGNPLGTLPGDLAAPLDDVMHTYRLNQISDPDGWSGLAHHSGIIGGTSFGPDISFGHAVADAMASMFPDDRIAIVKTAHNGTSLARDWMPGSGYLYEDSLAFVLEQAAALTAQGYTVQLEGFFWVQGYGDLGFQDQAENYGGNLSVLMDAIRSDLAVENLPLFFTQQHIDSQRQNYIDAMRLSQNEYLLTDRNATLIDIDDLTFRDENIHYDGASTIEIGQRFADAYLGQFGAIPGPGASIAIGLAGAFAARRRR